MGTQQRTRKTAAAPQQAETEAEKQEREKKEREDGMRKAYSEATTQLREENRDRFDAILSEKAQARGLTYTPKPTPQQKAADKVAELVKQYGPEVLDIAGVLPDPTPADPDPTA